MQFIGKHKIYMEFHLFQVKVDSYRIRHVLSALDISLYVRGSKYNTSSSLFQLFRHLQKCHFILVPSIGTIKTFSSWSIFSAFSMIYWTWFGPYLIWFSLHSLQLHQWSKIVSYNLMLHTRDSMLFLVLGPQTIKKLSLDRVVFSPFWKWDKAFNKMILRDKMADQWGTDLANRKTADDGIIK